MSRDPNKDRVHADIQQLNEEFNLDIPLFESSEEQTEHMSKFLKDLFEEDQELFNKVWARIEEFTRYEENMALTKKYSSNTN